MSTSAATKKRKPVPSKASAPTGAARLTLVFIRSTFGDLRSKQSALRDKARVQKKFRRSALTSFSSDRLLPPCDRDNVQVRGVRPLSNYIRSSASVPRRSSSNEHSQ